MNKRYEVIGLETPPKALVLCSGGICSTVLAHYMHNIGWTCDLLVFDYGQASYTRQLSRVMLTANAAKANTMQSIDIREAMPEWTPTTWRNFKEYEDRIIQPDLYTPNRNAIFAQIALGYAIKSGASCIAFGFTATSRSTFPDRDHMFIELFNTLIRHTLRGYSHPSLSLYAPFMDKAADNVIATGLQLGVQFNTTWSCYHRGVKHCGKCTGCLERNILLQDNNITEYGA